MASNRKTSGNYPTSWVKWLKRGEEKLKITLISPSQPDPLWKKEKEKAIFPPLNLAMVASLTPPGIDVGIVDENIDDINFDQDVDLVALTAMTALAPRAYEIADHFRSRGVPVVMGGMHASAVPEEALQHVDTVVTGEAEGSWPQLVADFMAGNMKQVYNSPRSNIECLRIPNRQIIPMNRYLLPNTVQTTRGCPFACEFCSVTHFFGHRYRSRPVEDVVEEVSQLEGKYVAFIDDNIIGSPSYAKSLFKALIPLNKKWISQASLNMTNDEELLDLAAEAGCIGLFVGFETISPASLKAMGKRQNHVDEYHQAVNKWHDRGIAIEGAFVFGLDEDDDTVFEKTLEFAKDARLEAAQFGILTPFPGTPLRDRLEKADRILPRSWSDYSVSKVVYKPLNMSPKVLQQGYNWAWKEFYSFRSISKRLGVLHKNGAFLWILNLNVRKRFSHFMDKLDVDKADAPVPAST